MPNLTNVEGENKLDEEDQGFSMTAWFIGTLFIFLILIKHNAKARDMTVLVIAHLSLGAWWLGRQVRKKIRRWAKHVPEASSKINKHE